MAFRSTITVTSSQTALAPAFATAREIEVQNLGATPVFLADGTTIPRGWPLSITVAAAAAPTAATVSGTTTVQVIDLQSNLIGPRYTGASSDVIEETWVTGEVYPRYRRFADGSTQIGAGIATPGDEGTFGNWLTTGEETIHRDVADQEQLASATQGLKIVFFTARKTETTTQVVTVTGSTAAAATPSLCRVGLYSVNSAGDLTLVASTPNDTALWAATRTRYAKAWSVPYAKVRGQRLAVGVLCVTAGQAPFFIGAAPGTTNSSNLTAQVPVLSAAVGSQADLPSTVAVGSLATGQTARIYAEILP